MSSAKESSLNQGTGHYELEGDIPEVPLPQYEALAELHATAAGRDDGRIDIDLSSGIARRLSRLVTSEKRQALAEQHSSIPSPPEYSETSESSIRLNIVIQVVGSRGDVQPFVALGTELQRHGHRVRLATHGQFDKFVRDAGLEFYSIGGDPVELMAYMVKNPGLFPSMKTLRGGEIQRKRKMVNEMLHKCWESCICPDDLTGRPFVADAIIANPPSFAHVHCAQVLGIPVHLMFTMPWTSTREFCHPLANLRGKDSDMSPSSANYVSYRLVEWMTWQGLGDIINSWRETLDLQPIPFSEGPCLAETLEIPFTYCWSPALVPKPEDWANNIDVCGFFFRDMPSYEPSADLKKFLSSGSAPVYIGFGSIVIDDPEALTRTIREAVLATGTRAIVSRGWSKLGGDSPGDDNIFFLGDCPHEWLFQHVAAVVHHGGAGTTACGLLNARPTAIIPFFGDQPFWGHMVNAGGAGPAPIPFKSLNKDNLADAIRFCMTPEASAAARTIANKMSREAGVRRAVASFHANLPLKNMRCDMLPNQAAAWTFKTKDTTFKLSKIAAEILSSNGKISRKNLKAYQSHPIHIENRRWDPVTAALSSLTATSAGLVTSASDIVIKPIQAFRPVSSEGTRRDSNGGDSSNGKSNGQSSIEAGNYTDETIFGKPAALTVPPQLKKSRSTGHLQQPHGAVAALKGSASGVGGFFKYYCKGMLLDLPYAVTEGMRNAPALYGGQVYDPGAVTDWKSGGVAAGKNFTHGIVEGIGGIVMEPIRGGKKDGVAGAAKGVGVGLLNMTTKVTSGTVGLVTMPGQGVYQSVRAFTKRKTGKTVAEARRLEGGDMFKRFDNEEQQRYKQIVMEAYKSASRGKGGDT
ncbi:udp- transferase [Fusarium longipes]|uniref:Udp-transferase n=1 Tax=Fusarium longipes TaxID=694270 RepID=A0A395T5S3_9HYPO|nr:udp- transferase [Fusarium longipes]